MLDINTSGHKIEVDIAKLKKVLAHGSMCVGPKNLDIFSVDIITMDLTL